MNSETSLRCDNVSARPAPNAAKNHVASLSSDAEAWPADIVSTAPAATRAIIFPGGVSGFADIFFVLKCIRPDFFRCDFFHAHDIMPGLIACRECLGSKLGGIAARQRLQAAPGHPASVVESERQKLRSDFLFVAVQNRHAAGRAKFGSARVTRIFISSCQQRLETGLRKMGIAGQRLAQPFVLHGHERDAIGERPLFVGTFLIKLQAALKQIGGCGQDFDLGILREVADERGHKPAACGGGQSIRHFRQNPFGGDDMTAQVARGGDGSGVMLVGAVQQRHEVEGIREHRFHFWR